VSFLSVEEVSRSFGGVRAVSGFRLDIGEGELVALIGPNGAGKTTVFNLITGVCRPDAGTIRFRGSDLVGCPPHRIVEEGIARTFQNIRLFRDLTVLDNVRTAHFGGTPTSVWSSLLRTPGCRRDERAVVESSLRFLSALGLEAEAGARAGSLPYGRQRRLEIARALATQPALLLLDEPAAGMNPAEVEEMMELILRLRKEFSLTVLLIEHQMRMVMGAAERIVVLEFGETIAEGTPEEIRTNPKVVEAYLGGEVT
jgi:branched-chain amino acid transport system ATP-binding protein